MKLSTLRKLLEMSYLWAFSLEGSKGTKEDRTKWKEMFSELGPSVGSVAYSGGQDRVFTWKKEKEVKDGK